MCSASASSSTSSLVPLVQSLQFRSGSLSKTAGQDSGHGVFEWPSGLKYTGEYVDRKRHGYGVQLWPDGAKYEGYFHDDQRQGSGRHSWENGEEYEGEYLRDKKHGCGAYRWPSGAYMSGTFKQDCKDGVCVYVSAEGEKFEGLYQGDERDGEGVLTYPGGRQDVGIWKGTKLIKLRFTVKEAYFNPGSCASPLKSPNSSLGSPDVKQRGMFGPKGHLEVASEEFIQAAGTGDVAKVASMLKTGAVHVDVADRNGHTALFAAAIHSRPEVINVLLDYGADVNMLDSIGVTALNASHHVLFNSLPQVHALLKLLPRLEYPTLPHPSHPHSTTLTDCTLHTSDFLSTPHTLHTPHNLYTSQSTTCSECQGICLSQKHKAQLSSKAKDLYTAHSYPLIPTETDPNKVKFSSIGNIYSQRPRSNDGRVRRNSQPNPLLNGHAHQTPLMDLAIVQYNARDHTPQLQSPTRPISNCDTPLGHSSAGYSVTASVNGEILGVSPDVHSEAVFSELEISRVSLPSQELSSSQESLSDASLNIKGEDAQNSLTPNLLQLPPPSSQSRASPLNLTPGAYSPLYSSSVFSSTQYGPIVSAAQSTTLSCGHCSMDESSTSLSDTCSSVNCETAISLICLPPEATITLLLKRGADPNLSSLPLPPLLYAIRSGDVQALQRLTERGADVNQPLPKEVGGHSPLVEAASLVGPNPLAVMEILLKYGAQMNPSQNTTNIQDTVDKESLVLSTEDVERVEAVEGVRGDIVAGENEGKRKFSPLHMACSHRDLSERHHEQLSSTVLSMVDLLLQGGANVNLVALGHSPLSLAIFNGHDKVVGRLLSRGGDPNLPLGQGVCTALCSVITHSALKTRDTTNSLIIVGQLLQHGASFTQPVRVPGTQKMGTLADFAHAAFKEDKRLSCLKYSALSKPERARYRAWKRLLDTFVHLYKCRALHSIALRENAWLQMQIEQQIDNRLQIRRERLLRTTSAIHVNHPPTYRKPRNIHSAGGVPNKSHSKAEVLPSFPIHTLKTAIRKVSQLYGPTLSGNGSTSEEECPSEVSTKGTEKRVQQLKELFGQALDMFAPKSNTTVEQDNPDQIPPSPQNGRTEPEKGSQWTLSSFCYECGRSAVCLTKCPGCPYVYYCSQDCRIEAYKRGHKEECSAGFVRQSKTPKSTTKRPHTRGNSAKI